MDEKVTPMEEWTLPDLVFGNGSGTDRKNKRVSNVIYLASNPVALDSGAPFQI